MNKDAIQNLLNHHFTGASTESEKEALWHLLRDPAYDAAIKEWVANVELPKNEEVSFQAESAQAMLQAIFTATETHPDHQASHSEQSDTTSKATADMLPSIIPVHRIHFLKTTWFRYAAILLLVAGTATFLYLPRNTQKDTNQTASTEKQDILPGGNKAILTLSDGSTIILDSTANGALGQQGGTKILKLDAGKLAYQADNASGEILYNKISTPNGGQYQITLSDGSQVWLNAASSIRFPTAFTGKDRKVETTGEVYFEISPDKQKPFYVNVGSTQIQVLGTSFNVSAYPEEKVVKTTLLSGSVQVNAYKHLQTLRPGQQLQITDKGNLKLDKNVDIEQVMAWKNGLFNFKDVSLIEVMQQLSRWYDIEVIYEKNIPEVEFWGEINRNTALSDVLKALKKSDIHFRIEEKRLIIMP